MKNVFVKMISVVLFVCILVGGAPSAVASQQDVSSNISSSSSDELRGVWISFLEMQTMLTGKTEKQFTSNIKTAFDNIKDYGLNTVFVQVRPYSDALYKSQYFPWSHIVTGTEGKDPGFDPLKIMVDEAHTRGLKIEAWINPYRIRPADNNKPLSENSYAAKWIKDGDRSVIQHKGLISYNPSSTKAKNLIINGIKEIVQNYNIDGIHIDDYFYPTTDASFDKTEYDTYKNGGGKMSQGSWRRAHVEDLIKRIYSGIKEIDSSVLFGISPQSNISKNYSEHYLNIEKITSNTGYCDYICPQIYFGMDHKIQPFRETLDQWDDIIKNSKIDLYIGIASYKIGTVDSYAGSGKNEWVNNTDRMAEMVTYGRNAGNYGGFILYRYDHLFKPASSVSSKVKAEKSNLKNIMY